MYKYMILSVASLLMVSMTVQAGGIGSGGGSEVESAFRLRAYELINMVKGNSSADAICSAATMQNTLESTQIDVVDFLQKEGHPIQDLDLDAYTTPLNIQLKKDAWTSFFNSPGTPVQGRSVDTLILHEVMRATGGTCNDDRFVLSDRVETLIVNTPAPKDSRLFKLFENLTISGEYQQYSYICDRTPVDGQLIVCLNSYAGPLMMFEAIVHHSAKGWTVTQTRTLIQINYDAPLAVWVRQSIGMADQNHPLYVEYDYSSGQVGMGFDPTNLQH